MLAVRRWPIDPDQHEQGEIAIMDVELPEELRLLKKTVRAFVDRELIPIERTSMDGHRLRPEIRAQLEAKAKAAGLWLLDVPEEYGGQGLSYLGLAVVWEELARTIALPPRGPGVFGPDVKPILFTLNDKDRFDKAAQYSTAAQKFYIGNVARTINIPTLGMMFLHPRVNERFEFTDGGEENVGGRILRKAIYKEVARPTLIKTTRGRDLALTGFLWIDPFTGTVVKSELNAADPIVRCQVSVTFRRDEALDLWVPERMEEYYKAYSGLDDILATATYTNVRRILKSDLER